MTLKSRAAADRVVRPLGAAILKAIDAGDIERAETLVAEMVRIGSDPTSGDACVSAFDWLDTFTEGMLGDALRRKCWREPQHVIDMVKALRRLATNPTTSATDRDEPQRMLEKYGFDEESLRLE